MTMERNIDNWHSHPEILEELDLDPTTAKEMVLDRRAAERGLWRQQERHRSMLPDDDDDNDDDDDIDDDDDDEDDDEGH